MNYLSFHWLYLIAIHSVLCQKILPDISELILDGEVVSFELSCIDTANITWTYPTASDSSKHTLSYKQENGMHELILTVENISYMDTGYYYCRKSEEKEPTYAKIYIYVFDNIHYLAIKDDYTVLTPNEFGDIIIPCKPTLPDIVVKLINTEEETEMKLDYDPKKGFTFKSPRIKDSKVLKCVAFQNNDKSGSYDYDDYDRPTYEEEKYFQLLISPIDKCAKPLINSSGAIYPVEGRSVSLNCSILMKLGSSIFIRWKYPKEDVKNRTFEGEQQEILIPEQDLKLNYRILTFWNLTSNDAGDYICEVEDSFSLSKENTSYYLGVFDPNHPFLDMKILTDVNNTLKAEHPKIQWLLNVTSYPAASVNCEVPSGQIINIDSSPSNCFEKYRLFFDGKMAKFVVNHLEIKDTGSYKFTASNGNHTKTVEISLYVEGEPVTQISLENKLNFAHEPSEILCSITAYPLPKVTWFAKKCHLYPHCENSSTKLLSNEMYTREVIKPYLIKSTLHYRPNDTTILYCQASNSVGMNTSKIPFFIADVKDGFGISISSSAVTVGDNIKLTCAASKYIYKNNIIWHFNRELKNDDTLVQNLAGVKILSSETDFSYQSVINIKQVKKSHSGRYVCSVNLLENGVNINSTAIVDVKDVEKPIFTFTNLNGSSWKVATGKEVRMECLVRGIPKPTLVWYKNNEPVVVRENDYRLNLEQDNQIFVIRFAIKSDRGKYMCIASNKGGNVAAFSTLIVKDSRTVADHPNHAFTDITVISNLRSDTKNNGDPKIQWMFNITSHPETTENREEQSGEMISSESSPWLSFTGPLGKFVINRQWKNKDTGTYKFTVINQNDKKTMNMSLYYAED